MKLFTDYLQKTKTAFTESDQPLRLALGNTSGDMDSIVGALGLAYYLHLKTGQLWTPVINCPSTDLALKTEIYCHMIEDCKLDPNALIFWDELVAKKRPVEEIALIDHNLLDEAQAKVLGDDAHSKVRWVYDHHVDTKFYPAGQLHEYIVKFIGSACSILANKMAADEHLFDKSLFEGPLNLAYLVGAAVVLDTHNFKEALRDKKWNGEDEQAYKWLCQFATLDKAYFDKMQDNKFNQKIALKFGVQGNFRRDYKTYYLSKNGI
jgi:inorganic pyrophosphatase/exopolyphosphatase